MSENQKSTVEANSREFSRGVEAGLDSEDTKFWQAGYELGQELHESATQERAKEITPIDPDSPLLLADTLDGQKYEAQDEKDETEE